MVSFMAKVYMCGLIKVDITVAGLIILSMERVALNG